MLPTPVPPTAIDAGAPTSRSTFRLLVKALGATNREADDLRHRLLAVTDDDGLVRRLRSLDADDPDGARGIEARLAVWFDDVDSAPGRLVAAADPTMAGLSPEFAARLCDIDLGAMGEQSNNGEI